MGRIEYSVSAWEKSMTSAGAYPPGTDFGELIKNLPDEPVAPPVGEPGGGDGPQPSGGPDDEPRPTGMSRTLKLTLGVAGGAALAAAAYVWRRRSLTSPAEE